MSEHILWETINEQKEKIADLKKENRLLGERCNQLLKDKGYLTDKCKSFEEENNKLLDVINNQDVKIADLEKDLNWERNTKSELAEHLGNANNKIIELEEQNKVLLQNLEDTEIINKDSKHRIKVLEKENAELKQKLEALEGQTPWKDIKDKSEVIGKLTKAKEILQVVLDKWKKDRWILYSDEKIKQIENLMEQTEQFLREIEK